MRLTIAAAAKSNARATAAGFCHFKLSKAMKPQLKRQQEQGKQAHIYTFVDKIRQTHIHSQFTLAVSVNACVCVLTAPFVQLVTGA